MPKLDTMPTRDALSNVAWMVNGSYGMKHFRTPSLAILKLTLLTWTTLSEMTAPSYSNGRRAAYWTRLSTMELMVMIYIHLPSLIKWSVSSLRSPMIHLSAKSLHQIVATLFSLEMNARDSKSMRLKLSISLSTSSATSGRRHLYSQHQATST